jgi:hypothetical protein
MPAMKQTLLEKVRAKLLPMKHKELRWLGHVTGISYDTLLRMKSPSYDPGFSKVQTLAERFLIWKP